MDRFTTCVSVLVSHCYYMTIIQYDKHEILCRCFVEKTQGNIFLSPIIVEASLCRTIIKLTACHCNFILYLF